MPRARVILATYNQIPFLEKVLPGYLRQTATDFTLVLADDGSRDDQVEFIRSWVPRFAERGIVLEHVWHPDAGWQKNRIMNEAVRRAGDEQLLIFSDADCIPPGRFVERHLAVHEPLSFHVAGCFRWSEETSNRVTVEEIESGRFESIGCERCWKKLRDRRRKSLSKWAELTRRKNRPKVIGLNMACDRALFEAVNGFDERFRMPYLGEDTDLRDRLMRHRPRPRVKVLYTENDVYHLYHPYTEDKPRRATNRAYYDTKRPMRCVMGLEQPEVDPEGAG